MKLNLNIPSLSKDKDETNALDLTLKRQRQQHLQFWVKDQHIPFQLEPPCNSRTLHLSFGVYDDTSIVFEVHEDTILSVPWVALLSNNSRQHLLPNVNATDAISRQIEAAHDPVYKTSWFENLSKNEQPKNFVSKQRSKCLKLNVITMLPTSHFLAGFTQGFAPSPRTGISDK